MAYRGLGDTADWWRTYASPSEVYVWRVKVTGFGLASPDDPLALLRAASRSPNLLLDARGVCVSVDSEGSGTLDVVFTIREYALNANILALWPDAEDVAAAVLADDSAQARFPKLGLAEPEWLQLTGPAASVDFWRSAPILWDRQLGPSWQGGPTQAFADRDGVYIGAADAGPGLTAWKTGKPPVGSHKKGNGQSWVPLAAVGVLLGVLWFSWRGRPEAEGAEFWARRARRREQRS
jgi:hypothetical protein